MKSKLIAPIFLASAAALSMTAQASMSFTSASAYIDWSSFNVQIVDTNLTDGITAAITWTNQGSDVGSYEGFGNYSSSSDWTSSINVAEGVANGFANAAVLQASFTGAPTALSANANAYRYGDFTVTDNTVLLFTVDASTSIDLPIPLNGSAYAWSTLDVDGTGALGFSNQHGGTSKISWAAGLGNPVTDSGQLTAYFVNVSGGDINGTLRAGTYINSYGFIPAVPEPETYAMLLAGLGLMGFIARRRMK